MKSTNTNRSSKSSEKYVEAIEDAKMSSVDQRSEKTKKSENKKTSNKNTNNSTRKSTEEASRKNNDKFITSECSPVASLDISSDVDSYFTDLKKSSTPKGSNFRIVDSSTKSTSALGQKRKRRSSNSIEPSSQLISSSSSNATTASASRLVVNTPDTTQFALHTLTEYSEFNNVFTNPNAKKNIQNFHAYITDLGKIYNTKNTPMREMSTKNLTKIEETTKIRNTFGVDIGVKIVNAVRDIILLQIPQIVGDIDFNDHLALFEYIASFFMDSFSDLCETSYKIGDLSTENPLKQLARNEQDTGVFLIIIRVMVLRVLLFTVKLEFGVKVSSTRKNQRVEESIFQKLLNAMRAYNIRFMKFITEANFDMNRSIVSGANMGNQLNLCYEVYKHDPTYEYRDFVQSTFLTCIPGSSMVDAVLKRKVDEDTGNKTCEGRFPWDTQIGVSPPLPPYGRVCFLPKSKVDATIELSWYEGKSIVGKLIYDVRCELQQLEKQLQQLRTMVFEVCFPVLRPGSETTANLTDERGRNVWEFFCETFSKNELLQREEDAVDMSAYINSEYTFSFDKKSRNRYMDGTKLSMSHILEKFATNFTNLLFLVTTKLKEKHAENVKVQVDKDSQNSASKTSSSHNNNNNGGRENTPQRINRNCTNSWEIFHELDKAQLQLMGEKVLSAIKRIQEVVHTCDMNLWISCLLNNQGFLIKHPVMKMKLGQQDKRQRFVRDQNEMARHLGTASFARVLLWSYHTYNLKDVAYFPPDFHYRVDLTGQQGGMSSVKKRKKGSMATMNSGKDINLPDIKQIQEFLMDSITSLEENDFYLLQCLLVDFHVLNKWTQPFSMKTKKNYVEGYGNDDTVLSETTNENKKTKITENLTNAWAFYKQVHSTTAALKTGEENDNDDDVFNEEERENYGNSNVDENSDQSASDNNEDDHEQRKRNRKAHKHESSSSSEDDDA